MGRWDVSGFISRLLKETTLEAYNISISKRDNNYSGRLLVIVAVRRLSPRGVVAIDGNHSWRMQGSPQAVRLVRS